MLNRLTRLFSARPTVGNAAEEWKDRGNAKAADGDLAAAAQCYREAIKVDADYAEAYNNLAHVYLQEGRNEEAERLLYRAIALKPNLANAHFNLANLHQARGRNDEAVDAYRQAIALSPNWAPARNRLGIVLSQRGLHEEAIACFQAAATLDPRSVEAHYNLGDALLECGRPDDALEPTQQALRLAPGFALAHHNLGKVFLAQNKLDQAAASFAHATAIDPSYAPAHESLGVVLHRQDRIKEAIGYYEQARPALPNDHSLLRNLGLALLAQGRLQEGWNCYEHRFRAGTPPRVFSPREWQGEDLTDKALLIWGEQGIGDEILYANAYADAIGRAGRCVIECAPKLVPLFSSSFPTAQVVPRTDPPHRATVEAIDFQCAAGMLAKWLRPTLESFPKRSDYLAPDAARVAYWRQRLGSLGAGIKVGFSWRSHNSAGARALYYTSLSQWGPIFTIPGLQFISLQYDHCADELDDARRRFGVPMHSFDEIDLFDDLAEAAALKQALDLVVSAPTATAFLSAALGVPTWMMTYTTPWQMLATDRIPWFPAMRCFSRRWDQAWEEVIADVALAMACGLKTVSR